MEVPFLDRTFSPSRVNVLCLLKSNRERTLNFNMEISQSSSRYVHANVHKITFKLTVRDGKVRYVSSRSRARNGTSTVAAIVLDEKIRKTFKKP